MFIVGTSGHIDHGKTTLIKALTGIDCDRLPEEKEREMTIDIGFANIDYPRFGTVSIIDVPGHERFIRNMVVGAWGVDLGLLVIAVDDGWMPQTEDHFRVLELLGIERIIVILNKIDLADSEMIDLAVMEVEERLKDTRFADADIVQVSAKNGKGVDDLREVILKNLRKLSKAAETEKPYLFVDRVFSSKGYGTIITGTLKNGRFHEDETVVILPQKRECRIKKIESHYQKLVEGTPSQRTALNLSGVTTEEIKRGSIIVRKNFFTESNDILAQVTITDEGKGIKNNLGIDVLVGTSQLKGKMILVDERQSNERSFTARIRFEREWFFYPMEPFIITLPGGYRVLGGGTVILPRYERIGKRKLKECLEEMQHYGIDDIIGFTVKIRRKQSLSQLLERLSQSEKTVLRSVETLLEKESIVRVGDYLLDHAFFIEAKRDIVDAISQNIGLNIKEIADNCGLDVEICKVLIQDVVRENQIIEKDNRYFAGDAVTVDTLSDDRKDLLERIYKSSGNGMELNKVEDALKRKIGELIKLGFIVSLDGNIVYHSEIYEDLKSRVMNLFNEKDKITIPEAKEVTSLSRKYIIPLLNKIESEGLIKRVGDFRVRA
jgi:selenocysteine-specific elongation factor